MTQVIHPKRLWTDEELNYLKNNYYKYTGPELVEKFGITKTTVYKKAAELGLIKQKDPTKVIIKQKRLHHPKGELARALGIGFSPWGS